MAEGAHRIGIRLEGQEAAEQQGRGEWQWHSLILGGVPATDFDLGDGMESQGGIGQDIWPEGWQRVGIGEEWDWSGLWTWGKETKKWLPPKFWWCGGGC